MTRRCNPQYRANLARSMRYWRITNETELRRLQSS
jgi:hypothetical protein